MRPSNLLSHLIVKRKRRNDESEASYDAFACHDVDCDFWDISIILQDHAWKPCKEVFIE